jgi:hypothetical protein
MMTMIPVAIQAWLINGFLVTAAVVIHYEMLRLLSALIPRWPLPHRQKVVIGLLGAMTAHVIEIWMFGLAYYGLTGLGYLGALEGSHTHKILDSIYFSFATYSSLGYGDIYPTGYLRFLAGLETLTGLVLITWTASFMFIEMQRFWDRR